MTVRVSAYLGEEVYDLFLRVANKVAGNINIPVSDSLGVRLAIQAWAKQEKVK